MTLFWLGLGLFVSVPVGVAVGLTALHFYLRWRYLHIVVRIFQEKPLFIIPHGQPLSHAEDVCFSSADGRKLRGCYVKSSRPRRGVILFGLEFGSNRWSCWSYCEHLVDAGYDVFAFETRGQGDSESQPGYDPLHWLTAYEVADARAAVAYLKSRPDADPRGIGFFGISKGAGAGLFAAAGDSYVRCCVTDGAFGTYTVLVPYMRQYFRIYNSNYFAQGLLPSWYYGLIGLVALREIGRERNCKFLHLEQALPELAPRPLFMIHGEKDTYIRGEMARALFASAREPKEFWSVPGAKHNQALQVAGDEYRRKVLEFFNRHLGDPAPAAAPGTAGHQEAAKLVPTV